MISTNYSLFPSSGSVAPFGEGGVKWFDRPKSWPRLVMGKKPDGSRSSGPFFCRQGCTVHEMLFGVSRCYNWKYDRLFFMPLNLLSQFWESSFVHETGFAWICIKQWHGKKEKHQVWNCHFDGHVACVCFFLVLSFVENSTWVIPSFQQTWQWNPLWCPLLTGL